MAKEHTKADKTNDLYFRRYPDDSYEIRMVSVNDESMESLIELLKFKVEFEDDEGDESDSDEQTSDKVREREPTKPTKLSKKLEVEMAKSYA